MKQMNADVRKMLADKGVHEDDISNLEKAGCVEERHLKSLTRERAQRAGLDDFAIDDLFKALGVIEVVSGPVTSPGSQPPTGLDVLSSVLAEFTKRLPKTPISEWDLDTVLESLEKGVPPQTDDLLDRLAVLVGGEKRKVIAVDKDNRINRAATTGFLAQLRGLPTSAALPTRFDGFKLKGVWRLRKLDKRIKSPVTDAILFNGVDPVTKENWFRIPEDGRVRRMSFVKWARDINPRQPLKSWTDRDLISELVKTTLEGAIAELYQDYADAVEDDRNLEDTILEALYHDPNSNGSTSGGRGGLSSIQVDRRMTAQLIRQMQDLLNDGRCGGSFRQNLDRICGINSSDYLPKDVPSSRRADWYDEESAYAIIEASAKNGTIGFLVAMFQGQIWDKQLRTLITSDSMRELGKRTGLELTVPDVDAGSPPILEVAKQLCKAADLPY